MVWFEWDQGGGVWHLLLRGHNNSESTRISNSNSLTQPEGFQTKFHKFTYERLDKRNMPMQWYSKWAYLTQIYLIMKIY